MPHGVLFRGGEEKACRQRFIKDGILEAVIGLPAGLFYGTGIPACVLVMNKDGADAQRRQALFINADREYRRARTRTRCGPKTSRKIDYVFTQSGDPKYSRRVTLHEIGNNHDYNLNIRRYVDNTPDPEPEDVQAHLLGGVPLAEVVAQQAVFAKFGLQYGLMFQPLRAGYLGFDAAISAKQSIRPHLEAAPALQATLDAHQQALAQWWGIARDDFARLEGENTAGSAQ